MIVFFQGGYFIADGETRLHKVLDAEQFRLQQQNQTPAVAARAEWPTLFPEHSARLISLSYPVTCAPCETMAEAARQARDAALTCPRGGTLYEAQDGTATIYADAQVLAIDVQRLGVRNIMLYAVEAVDPRFAELVLDEAGAVLTDEAGVPLEY